MNTVVVKVRRLISKNKAVAAGLTTFGGALATAAASWISTGNLDPSEVRVAAGGFVLALITAGVTYATSAGDAEVEPKL